MSDGSLNKCKFCCKRDNAKNRESKLEYYQQYDMLRSNHPKRVEARASYSKTENYRISHTKASKKYSLNNRKKITENLKSDRAVNKQKHYAREQVAYAIKTGKLIKPGTCDNCGTENRIEGHHPDYTKPLLVEWLCTKCHNARHH